MKSIIRLLVALVLIALMLPFAASCGDGADGWVVQVWQPSADGEPEALLAYGVVVEDGNHVLTVLDYEEDVPEELLVISSDNKPFVATIQAVDYRTSATLLQLQDANLPVAETGDIFFLESKQQVYARGWGGRSNEYMKTPINAYCAENISPLFFSVSITQEVMNRGKGWVSQPGAAITDSDGRVIGLLGRYWSKLVTKFGMPGDLPEAVNINSAMELFADSSHTSGPAVAIALKPYSGADIVPGSSPHTPINTIEGLDSAITNLLDELGEPLSFTDMLPYMFGLQRGFHPEDGIMLITAFTFPVELYDRDGSLLAKTKWVGIQWDRDEDKPDRLLYGSSPYAVEGAASIDGDISELLQVIQPVLQELP